MAFTAKDVMALREKTGCGMMDCKKALTTADGNIDKAIELLREKGMATAAKKAGRIASEGVVYTEINKEAKVGIMIEVNAETDFVAKNDKFMEFVKETADTIISSNPASVEELLELKGKGSDLTIKELLDEKIQMIGENIKIRRFVREEGNVVSYVHGDGRIGVLVKFDTDVADKEGFDEYAKNIAMQIAAINPPYLDREAVPASALEEEKKVLTAQAMNEGKPANIAEKIVMGRLGKFYKEQCLTEQDYIRDGELTVNKYTAQVAKELGGSIKIAGFVRYEKGEGLEKRHDDLAAEIAGMVK